MRLGLQQQLTPRVTAIDGTRSLASALFHEAPAVTYNHRHLLLTTGLKHAEGIMPQRRFASTLFFILGLGINLIMAGHNESQAADGKTRPRPKQLSIDLGRDVRLQMLLIPAGEFMMGSSDKAAPDNEPRHRVRITRPFYFGKYLVTQQQWETVMGKNPSYFQGATKPVENFEWEDCRQFLEKLNAKLGRKYGRFVLPTEAQWEYACRAGTTTRFYFGDDVKKVGEYAWYLENSHGTTHPIGEKKPNPWGLYDMGGNVTELCQDWWEAEPGYYKRSPVDDPTGPVRGEDHICRGCSWDMLGEACESACRLIPMRGASAMLGLRVVLLPEDK
jgi:formylglycine-generating enzyme required for sulfatase activity